jgi:hypothetical protein
MTRLDVQKPIKFTLIVYLCVSDEARKQQPLFPHAVLTDQS